MGSLQQLATDSTSRKYGNSKMNRKTSSKSKFAADAGHLCDEPAAPGRVKIDNLYSAVNSHNYKHTFRS
jgi:hypothetical protein